VLEDVPDVLDKDELDVRIPSWDLVRSFLFVAGMIIL